MPHYVSRDPSRTRRRRAIITFGVSILLFAMLQARLPARSTEGSFEVVEATIPELQAALADGRTTSRVLVQAYLARIKAYDAAGPKLNAIIALNPNALKEAEKRDAERAGGRVRGPLHGIPVIVKDNYDTTDMPTTAGSVALAGFIPPDDAFQVRKLREAGAVIIAKSNLHEFASGITTISSLGGQTRNPYDPEHNPGGSSGGTGAAIAASFAAVGMGSDTCGSIRGPSSHNNLVGLRPTKGLSSIGGIIPLSVTQDTGGPLARTVTDLAIVLDATIGEDTADPATRLEAGQVRPKFVDALKADALRGTRLGIVNALFESAPEDQEVARIVRAATDQMKKQGATTVEVTIPELTELLRNSSVIEMESKEDLDAYLSARPTAPVRSFGEILEKGLYDSTLGDSYRRRQASKGRGSEDYRKALEKRAAIREAVLKVMKDENVDALVYPTFRRKAAWIGDRQAGSNCQLSASSGFPAISVPAGFTDDGLPVGVEFYGRPFTDANLVALAYSYEQATHHRRAPALTPSLSSPSGLAPLSFEVRATGAEVAPSLGDTKAAAKGRFTFDPTTNQLRYAITVAGLRPDDILYASIHRAAKGENGPVLANVMNGGFEQISGSRVLTEPERRSLTAGELYLNIATRKHPAGELRAQLKK